MNKFLFITHITPRAKRSEFRQALIDLYFQALEKQTYSDWKVIVFGEEERTEGKFNYFRLADGTREERFNATKELLATAKVQSLFSEADYIIKLDDDDIIAPDLLERLKNFDGDLYYDLFHTFVDSSSGIITQQKRSWIASTCVHKTKHILSPWNDPGASPVGNLLYSDHSKAWHQYYSDKKSVAADKSKPVYLRVLSPTSITSGAIAGPPQTISDVSMENYYIYLRGFGNWKQADVKTFDSYLPVLAEAWKKFSGVPQKNLSAEITKDKPGKVARILKRIFSKGDTKNKK
ncbi:MAG: hypothetical protein M3R17_12170 [Bacteroidota bacterium]|nr:hypothetical protein [Bacteroidota bacterium]